ncbi:MAG: phosphoribosylanthranilate isomerase [Thermoguttaceae bacterium]|nr:phosphoribosylanthranilate isomerase [Thermoguttaceae bacterium]
MTLIKVCGIVKAEQVLPILHCGVDWLGLVFFRKSPRYVSREQAKEIASAVPSGRPLVMVTVDCPLTMLIDLYGTIADRTGRIQLHGNETVDYIDQLRLIVTHKKLPMPQIVRRVSTDQERKQFLPCCDKLLWEASGTMPGGNGLYHTWPTRDVLSPGDKFIIAGGLTPENVFHSLSTTKVSEVDVSGGVEQSPGNKSLSKIQAFVNAVQLYDQTKL